MSTWIPNSAEARLKILAAHPSVKKAHVQEMDFFKGGFTKGMDVFDEAEEKDKEGAQLKAVEEAGEWIEELGEAESMGQEEEEAEDEAEEDADAEAAETAA